MSQRERKNEAVLFSDLEDSQTHRFSSRLAEIIAAGWSVLRGQGNLTRARDQHAPPPPGTREGDSDFLSAPAQNTTEPQEPDPQIKPSWHFHKQEESKKQQNMLAVLRVGKSLQELWVQNARWR